MMLFLCGPVCKKKHGGHGKQVPENGNTGNGKPGQRFLKGQKPDTHNKKAA